MTIYTYDIGTTFSSGVIPGRLLREVIAEAINLGFTKENAIAFFKKTYFEDIEYNASGVIAIGTMNLETPRDMTPGELDAISAVFDLHIPTPIYITIADLGKGAYPGQTLFVSDFGTSGVLCYWNPTDNTWRRTSTDGIVATIP